MSKYYSHSRLLALPLRGSPAAGLLDTIQFYTQGNRSDLLMNYHELKLTARTELIEREGRPWERGRGNYIPRRLRFENVRIKEGDGLFTCLEDLPRDDPCRLINAALAWRYTDGKNYYLFDMRRHDNDTLFLTAGHCFSESRQDLSWEVSFERDWSPPPPSPPCLIPDPKTLRYRFGGDPISVRIGGKMLHRRLFIGGLDTQSSDRPDVSYVLNLGEDASIWTLDKPPHQGDRWAYKGEGSQGMTVEELTQEADWVISHLKGGERVLVHCSAGMNRSSTVCCAVLIRLEGISAKAALERVREHHPWARPDPRHWLALRWMASRQDIDQKEK